MLASLAAGKIDFGAPEVRSEGLTAPKELKFELDGSAKTFIKQAEKNFDELIGKHELVVQHYEGYGKNYIKTHRASPDAWAQLVKQLAFHKLAGRPGICYESCQTRKYQLGRTEVIRSASNESKAWAEAMLNPNETVSVVEFRGDSRLRYNLFPTRMKIVPSYSARRSRGIYSTRPGRQMARELIVTSLA